MARLQLHITASYVGSACFARCHLGIASSTCGGSASNTYLNSTSCAAGRGAGHKLQYTRSAGADRSDARVQNE